MNIHSTISVANLWLCFFGPKEAFINTQYYKQVGDNTVDL